MHRQVRDLRGWVIALVIVSSSIPISAALFKVQLSFADTALMVIVVALLLALVANAANKC